MSLIVLYVKSFLAEPLLIKLKFMKVKIQCRNKYENGWFMVFNTTFNNFSVISWRSVLLVEETAVP
jgi:hypothetical protein